MEIKTSASPALASSKALAFLNRYPYGCLEQTAAGAFPLLAADTLKKVGLLTETEAQSVVPKLESAAASILSMMLYNGSFSMWPGGETAWESASVFVSHFLFEAAERDLITLDSQVKNRINAYLYSIASDASKPRGIRAYATYVLALGGHTGAVRNAQNLLAGAAPDFATFLAGAALIRANYAGEGGEGYCNVYVSADSTWTVTGDSTVSSLENEGTIVDSNGKTVTIQGTDGTVYVQGDSEYTITTGSYSDTADMSGATAIQDQSVYTVEKPDPL